MVFKANIPQPTDIISQSQLDISSNYQAAYEIYGKPNTENENIGDHVALNDSNEDDRGAHKKLTLNEQSSDPSTLVNEMGLYSKETNGKSEIYYRQESDGDVSQITDNGGISVGGLVLRAYVAFDFQGKIIEVERLDSEGDKIKVPVSYNVTNVTPNQALVQGKNIKADWNINFTDNLPTDDYFWVLQSFNDPLFSILSNKVVQAQPYNSATYSDTVTTSHFRAVGINIGTSSQTITPAAPVLGRLQRIIFQAYTVI